MMRRGFMPAPAPDVEHDHLYQAMFTRHPAIRLLIDPESGRILDASEAAAAFYGYTLATLKSKTIFDLNQRSESEVRSIMEETLSHDRATFELQHKLASGEIRDVKIDSGRI
ncbi:MAG: PAS domain-containing protein, partial [Candidatus Hydrogenedentes bacterium]|nr:PAS domain-containing protein [Candidatus Hydrogenedentota bacterium]